MHIYIDLESHLSGSSATATSVSKPASPKSSTPGPESSGDTDGDAQASRHAASSHTEGVHQSQLEGVHQNQLALSVRDNDIETGGREDDTRSQNTLDDNTFLHHTHMVLKSPHHLAKISNVFEVFPSASFVWLHRELTSVVASCCSMNLAGLRALSHR
jgi:hypothetical protein